MWLRKIYFTEAWAEKWCALLLWTVTNNSNNSNKLGKVIKPLSFSSNLSSGLNFMMLFALVYLLIRLEGKMRMCCVLLVFNTYPHCPKISTSFPWQHLALAWGLENVLNLSQWAPHEVRQSVVLRDLDLNLVGTDFRVLGSWISHIFQHVYPPSRVVPHAALLCVLSQDSDFPFF